MCCQDDGSSSTLVEKVSQWQKDDCVFGPNSKRSMLLQLFAANFLHVCQACHLFLSIVYCVRFLSIVWWCSWVLQCLQISIFSLQYCHEETSQHGSYSSFLSGLLLFVIFDYLVWLQQIRIFEHLYRIEPEFRNAWNKTELEYICNWSSK